VTAAWLLAGTFSGIHKFFHSGTWYVIRNLLIFFAVVFWLAVGFWVYKDAKRRIEDPWLVALATILGLVPPYLGALVYMLFRPPEYLEDVRERELEIKEMEERLGGFGRCPVCRAQVEHSFLVCPVCTTKLRQACGTCQSPLDPLWQVCPYCETPVEPPEPLDVRSTAIVDPPAARRRSRSRAAGDGSE
jgi:hypothetical protein